MVNPDIHTWLTHPFADAFPTLNPEEFYRLKEDVRANGVLEAVTVAQIGDSTYIVDGRHRWRATLDLEEEGLTLALPYKELANASQEELASYVMSLNVHRRHLTPSMRAAMAVQIYERLQSGEVTPESLGVKDGITREVAGAAMGVNTTYVQETKAIKESHPDLFEQLHQGTMSLMSAKREIAARLEQVAEERISTTSVTDTSDIDGEDLPMFHMIVASHERELWLESEAELERVVRFFPTTSDTEITIEDDYRLFAILQGSGAAGVDNVQNGWSLASVWFVEPNRLFLSDVHQTLESFLRSIAMEGKRVHVIDLPKRVAEVLADAGMSAYYFNRND